MNWFARNLWELIGGPPTRGAPPRRAPAPARTVAVLPPRQRQRGRTQERYDALVVEMKRTYGVRIRKWRRSSSGCAWMVRYADGTIARLVESPYPRGPMSCAIFLHEIGHHAIGFGTYRPRCLEEYHAWRWSLETMRSRGFNVTDAVERRMGESMRYAVEKAKRRGLKKVPIELLPFLEQARRHEGT